MWKKFDTWMQLGFGYESILLEGTALIRGMNEYFNDKFRLEAFEAIGCAYRVQIATTPEVAEEMAKFFNREFEPTRGFVRENCG